MQRKISRILCAALLAVMCLLLAGCGKLLSPAQATPEVPTAAHFAGGDVEFTATELSMKLRTGETALLDSLTALRSADLSGSENEEEVAAWAKAHPNVRTRYTVTLPNGTVLDSDTTSADLSAMSAADCEAAARKLALLPGLASVNLGSEGRALKWSDIARLREILPRTTFKYAFNLYGKECNLADTTINLFRVPVSDNGNLIDEVMGYMPQLTYVDMDSCGLDPKRLEEINQRHPDAKVVFRVYFGDNYTARTDAERILASMASRGGMLTDDNVDGLYYCHDVKYLDLGHNTLLTNIGFTAQMPKLEVAILSMCNIPDVSPLANCQELEYLELANTYASDLRPLSGLKKLRHLNVASIGYDQPWDGTERIRLVDITPLYSLTDLERLWIGAFNPVPSEQVEEMRRRAPNCEIDLTVYEDPVGGRWRYVAMADYIYTYVDTYADRYIKLRQQFGDYDYSVYNFTWNDPRLDPNYDPANTPVPTPVPTFTPTPVPTQPPANYQSEEEEYEEYQYEDEEVAPYDPYLQNAEGGEDQSGDQNNDQSNEDNGNQDGGSNSGQTDGDNGSQNSGDNSDQNGGAQDGSGGEDDHGGFDAYFGGGSDDSSGGSGEDSGGSDGGSDFTMESGESAFPDGGGASAIEGGEAS